MNKNSDIPIRSSLNDQTSDVVSKGFVKLTDSLKLTNEFSLDQNFNELNYNLMLRAEAGVVHAQGGA